MSRRRQPVPVEQQGGYTRASGRDKPVRCTATHDVPWTERCRETPGHGGKHRDKAGREWG